MKVFDVIQALSPDQAFSILKLTARQAESYAEVDDSFEELFEEELSDAAIKDLLFLIASLEHPLGKYLKSELTTHEAYLAEERAEGLTRNIDLFDALPYVLAILPFLKHNFQLELKAGSFELQLKSALKGQEFFQKWQASNSLQLSEKELAFRKESIKDLISQSLTSNAFDELMELYKIQAPHQMPVIQDLSKKIILHNERVRLQLITLEETIVIQSKINAHMLQLLQDL